MNFGAILDKWEKQSPGGNDIIADRDTEESNERDAMQEKRRRLRSKRPDAELDIHGQTRDEALQLMEVFFNDAREKGFEKVLLIHGKGNHLAGESVLKRVVMDFIEHCPFAGESGKGKTTSGGESTTWVLLKN